MNMNEIQFGNYLPKLVKLVECIQQEQYSVAISYVLPQKNVILTYV